MAYDPNTDEGYVRLLVTDTDDTDPIFDDAEISAFISRTGGSLKLAAAAALEVIARSEVLVSKKIRTQDLQTDGPAVAAELRLQAAQLRVEAATEDATDWAFELVPMANLHTPELAENPYFYPDGVASPAPVVSEPETF